MNKLIFRNAIMLSLLFLGSILVSCEPKDPAETSTKITVNPDKFTFEATGNDEAEFTVTGADDWTPAIPYAAQKWLSAEKKDGKLVLKITDNHMETERKTTVTIKTPSSEIENGKLEITQKGEVDNTYYKSVSLVSATYYGDEYGNNNGQFMIVLKDNSDKINYIYLNGTSELSATPNKYTLTDGTYTPGGEVHGEEASTFVVGHQDANMKWTGTLVSVREMQGSDEVPVGVILVDKGYFTISTREDGGYVIKTRLIGTDIDTQEEMDGINFKYDGPIDFANMSYDLYQQTCTKVSVRYHGNEYGGGDATSAKYIISMFTGYIDSNGSVVPPYSRLEIEAYGDKWDGTTSGELSQYYYICTGDAYYWVKGYFIPCLNAEGSSGTVYGQFDAKDPTSAHTAIGIITGGFSVEKDGDIYKIETNMTGRHLLPQAKYNMPARVILKYEGPIELNGNV